ncbi:hypothetical protein [Pasteuria penetrans]|uniref:hypothetical protein n=1 Tax=Pasteuria penetrans TaxID=86005 RepID=UPI001CAA6A1C|nr:hypothetical protein [Pasteuria penetrans]
MGWFDAFATQHVCRVHGVTDWVVHYLGEWLTTGGYIRSDPLTCRVTGRWWLYSAEGAIFAPLMR